MFCHVSEWKLTVFKTEWTELLLHSLDFHLHSLINVHWLKKKKNSAISIVVTHSSTDYTLPWHKVKVGGQCLQKHLQFPEEDIQYV